jgi:hypothetical protein
MDIQEVSKDGRTIRFAIEGGNILIFDPVDSTKSKVFPLNPATETDYLPGSAEYINCVRGCYPLRNGSPKEYAYCLGLCCFG